MANKEGARKSGKFIAVCTTSDVCKTPVGNTVVPIPYPITANLNDSASTSPNVNFCGDPVFILNKSKVTRVTGDEPGMAGGVKSGTNRSLVEPIEGSTNFYVNKRPVVRHGDKCKMNNGNTFGKFIYQGGGGSKGGDSNPPIKPETPAEKSFLEKVGGLYDKLNIKPLQELKKGIQDGIDKVVEASGYNPVVMGIGAAATAANEVFVPDNLTDFSPGKLVTKGKKAYSAVKGMAKTEKRLATFAAREEKRLAEEIIKKKEAARKAQQEAAKKKGKNGTTIKGKKKEKKVDPCKALEGGVPGEKYKGGKYGKIAPGGKARGQEAHHMPADSASPIKQNNGPAIQMDRADHKQTASYDNKKGADEYRKIQKALMSRGKAGRFNAMLMDIADIKKKFGNKYDSAIAQMIAYSKCKEYI